MGKQHKGAVMLALAVLGSGRGPHAQSEPHDMIIELRSMTAGQDFP